MLTGSDFENISLLVGFENIVASSISRKDLRQYEGQSIAAIAEQQGKDPFTCLFDLLQAAHCDVTMIEMAPDIITDAVAQPRACLLEHIRKYNVKVHTHTKLTKVGEGTVYAEEYGEPITFKHIDMLVNAMGVRSYNPLQEQLAGLDCKVVVVGDAKTQLEGVKSLGLGDPVLVDFSGRPIR